LIDEEAEDECIGSPRENRCIIIGNKEGNNEDDNQLLLRIQGDLRRALTSKYEEAPLDNCTSMLQLQETHVKT
jgi:hypothetical protein